MALEIERKFLVCGEFKSESRGAVRIIQAYLNSDPERTVRVRLIGSFAKLTIKGKSSDDGLSRYEMEHSISSEEAMELFKICEPGIIDKIRYKVPVGERVFEVDEFGGDNKGLVVAEIELASENESFERPSWLGKEVTGDSRYYNSALSKCPFKNWEE